MSCIACEEAQESAPNNLTLLKGGTYIRVGNANVLIVGCHKHLEELMGQTLAYPTSVDDDE